VLKPIYVTVFVFSFLSLSSYSQELDKSASVSIFGGIINYQGDLKPNSFTLQHSNPAFGIAVRKPLNRWFTIRAGANMGKLEANDAWNRDYLKGRNLSFTTTIKEAYAGLEINVLDISTKKFTPYLYGGVAVFHFNPWANDNNGVKTYLKPLGTEGQGIAQYPDKKEYNLTQLALPFGGGIKYAISDAVSVGIEFSQRKTFTDYIDDVSSNYVDRNVLLQAKGAKAVEMAYRGGQSPLGQPLYPQHGEQRGTPSQMDWYYFLGMHLEIKTHAFSGLFRNNKTVSSQRCPRNLNSY
jgi:opacity protein-like surface antigen